MVSYVLQVPRIPTHCNKILPALATPQAARTLPKTAMPHSERHQPEPGPPPEFVEQVKQALDHLYDIDFLERHPLTLATEAGETSPPTLRGQRLRWELSAAIEALNPGAHVPFAAPPARIYNLLSLRYVERRSVLQAAQELNLSERQAHRDLRQGEERVAAHLWARRPELSRQEPRALQLSSFEAEMARFEPHPRPTDLGQLLRHARQVVAPLAAQRGIDLQIQLPPQQAVVSLDPAIAEQVLVNILSHATQQAAGGYLTVRLHGDRDTAQIILDFAPGTTGQSRTALDLVTLQIADRLGWKLSQETPEPGLRTICLQIPTRGPTVLVIDDNEGLVSLLERYLTDQACRVVAATNGQEGLQLLENLVPDAIILDIMMPEMHGWEFLQRVRAKPALARVPVIICSVIHNPQLAYSLGASFFLPKPVRRRDILDALQQMGVM